MYDIIYVSLSQVMANLEITESRLQFKRACFMTEKCDITTYVWKIILIYYVSTHHVYLHSFTTSTTLLVSTTACNYVFQYTISSFE